MLTMLRWWRHRLRVLRLNWDTAWKVRLICIYPSAFQIVLPATNSYSLRRWHLWCIFWWRDILLYVMYRTVCGRFLLVHLRQRATQTCSVGCCMAQQCFTLIWGQSCRGLHMHSSLPLLCTVDLPPSCWLQSPAGHPSLPCCIHLSLVVVQECAACVSFPDKHYDSYCTVRVLHWDLIAATDVAIFSLKLQLRNHKFEVNHELECYHGNITETKHMKPHTVNSLGNNQIMICQIILAFRGLWVC